MKRKLRIMMALVMAFCWVVCFALADEAVASGVKIDLTGIVQAVIALASAIITAYIVPWIKSRTAAQQQAYIRAMVNTAVYAAEQIYGAGGGAEKLEYAERWLAERGVKLETEKTRALIEAEVYRLQNPSVVIEDEPTE